MATNFQDVRQFHLKFGLHEQRLPAPGFLPPDLHEFRAKFIQEELDEFNEAYAAGDLAKAFDALIDMTYVILGTADLMNLPWQDGWQAVQFANMSKVRAQSVSESLRGSTYDVVKPRGWKPPDIEGVLSRYKFFMEKRNGDASHDP